MAVLGPDGRFADVTSPYEGETDEEIRESIKQGRFKGGAKVVRVSGGYFTGSKQGDENLHDFLGSIGALGGMAKEEYEAKQKAKDK